MTIALTVTLVLGVITLAFLFRAVTIIAALSKRLRFGCSKCGDTDRIVLCLPCMEKSMTALEATVTKTSVEVAKGP